MARAYRSMAATDRRPDARADAFRRLLFEAEGFRCVQDLDSTETLHIDTVLARRRGYCLSLSVIALAVAEAAGEPLHGVAAPNHFFVRYDDGSFRRNLELTRGGAPLEDDELRGDRGAARADSPDAPVYFRNLEASEIRAFLLHNRGYVALREGRLERAGRDLREAAARLPGLAEAHRNLGVLLAGLERWPEATRAFGRALRILPDDADTQIDLALCRRALGEHDEAVQDLEMVLAIDPAARRARELLHRWRTESVRGGGAGTPPARETVEIPDELRPGLRARFYADRSLQNAVAERVDATVDFDWKNAAPAAGVPRDGFGARWSGFLLAPRDGAYRFYVAANDGARVVVGGRTLLENWRDMGYRNWFGAEAVVLEAGLHPLRIEHFDRRGGARILLRVGIEGEVNPLSLERHLWHRPGDD